MIEHVVDGSINRLWDLQAVVFDMDGVVTDTAESHARSWKDVFDEYLRQRSKRTGEPFREFGQADYLEYVDGKPRYDGVRSFLASRGIHIPEGKPSDPIDAETICGIGNLKNHRFLESLQVEGASAYLSTVQLVKELERRGIATAVISSSRNMDEVLSAADASDLFRARVDGVDSDRLGLPGKPDPAIFVEAANRLGVRPEDAAIVEDALSGVEAGRAGGFALVVGVDRGGQADQLRSHGADLVVPDLAVFMDDRSFVDELPSALEESSLTRVSSRRLAFFLDYDGTLTPIVAHPADAILSDQGRETLARLSASFPVAVVSGRDRAEVEALVGLEGIYYAGSHGFDISGPGGFSEQFGADYADSLSDASDVVAQKLAPLGGVWVERKRYAVAVHFRQAPDAEDQVRRVVQEVAERSGDLRVSGGKKIFELRPDLDWDKGRAVMHLLDVLGLSDSDVTPLYLGDDETDEDVFRMFRSRPGVGIVVGTDHRPTLADFALADPGEAIAFLDRLAKDRQ
ncbi:MAG: trehalose-phosphatase [Acidimicrobiia bacterium]